MVILVLNDNLIVYYNVIIANFHIIERCHTYLTIEALDTKYIVHIANSSSKYKNHKNRSLIVLMTP